MHRSERAVRSGYVERLALVAEFDAREGYVSFGLASSAQWLTHACGIAHSTAVEHVRVGKSLVQHPRIADEMGTGRLSYSQVPAISRIVGPGAHGLVDDLIEVARHGTAAQLEILVRGLRTVDHNENATDPGGVPQTIVDVRQSVATISAARS